ncbi:hypothetical protein [Paenibacillus hamazuiensis]|uniref:hypothetical protein n=1 Tax=Paenibacillus hamazuiensis TaxID=2936508 RepID=UPI00200BA19F|nr:hypothetical protein [Paenibacillus hamazuiensis]
MINKKKLAAGILSAALLFNGTIILTQPAFADDDWSYKVVKAPLDSQKVVDEWMTYLVMRVSTIADKDYNDIQAELASGGTLAEASGISASELTARLNQAADQIAAAAAQSYEAKPEQIEKLRSELYGKTADALVKPGFAYSARQTGSDFTSLLNDQLKSLAFSAAQLAGKDYQDVSDALNQGGTIQNAVGLSAGYLVSKLTEPLEQQIQEAHNSGNISKKQAEQLEKQAEEKITAAIQTPGGAAALAETAKSGAKIDGAVFFQKRLQSIIRDASLLTANFDADELVYEIEHGKSLLKATGLSSEQLISGLQGIWSSDIDDAYRNGQITAKQAEELRDQARQLIASAVRG